MCTSVNYAMAASIPLNPLYLTGSIPTSVTLWTLLLAWLGMIEVSDSKLLEPSRAVLAPVGTFPSPLDYAFVRYFGLLGFFCGNQHSFCT